VFETTHTDYLVPFDGSFSIANAPTHPSIPEKWRMKNRLGTAIERLDDLQRVLWASDSHALLIIFQGMDSCGKDSTIRAVMRGINPAGCQVFNFKQPSKMDLDHDFLWRTTRCLPERGRIGIFNRSQYEEVLVVRVHPELLKSQKLPRKINLDEIWDERLESIHDQEKHLARNGMVILKFWLNISREEQKKRLLARLNDPGKHWKFDSDDIAERTHWDAYMQAYEATLNATSRSWAPWYAIPADSKPYMRARVAEVIVDALSGLGLAYPQPSTEEMERFEEARNHLSGPDAQ
jgi:PPK2 family polyphosphate:nucleotide phosphotransferase